MKKVIVILIIFSLMFISFFTFKKDEEKENENISIIIETNEGNIESITYPDKEYYEYSNINCKNTSDNIYVNFNKETWKLNLSVEEEKVDGKFNCIVHFKQRNRLGTEVITSKYKENNSDGLIKLNQPETEQTPALVEYRYSGSNEEVKNYVEFNNEIWRIIGVSPVDDGTGKYEERLKIIREESIGDYAWDTSEASVNDGWGISQWGESGSYEGADLMRLLNPGYENESINNSLYYNRTNGKCYNNRNNVSTSCDFSSTGLTSDAKSMIDTVKYYTGTVGKGYYNVDTNTAYKKERGFFSFDLPVDNVERKDFWIGKVGLMNMSDYGYASNVCYNNVLLNDFDNEQDYRLEKCKNSNWIYNSDEIYTINPYYSTEFLNNVRTVDGYGQVDAFFAGYHRGVRPVVYLKPEVKIINGTGEKESPFYLKLN